MKRSSSTPPVEVISTSSINVDSKDKVGKREIKLVADGFEEHGQINAIVVTRSKEGETTLRSGLAQLEAAKSLGWKEIKATVVPIDDDTSEELIEQWVNLIEGQQKFELDDYQLARAAILMEDKYKIKGSEFARQLGLSNGYTYNLMRWYRSAPDKVREAWKQKHPHINQAELERYSHMTKNEALDAWELRLRMRSSVLDQFQSGRKGGKAETPLRKNRRATEKQIAQLQTAIDESALVKPVKDLCTNILKFVLGAEKEVRGITDYSKLPLLLIDKEATKDANAKNGREQRA